MDPTIAKLAGAMVVVVVLAAVSVAMFSATRTPTYEALAEVRLGRQLEPEEMIDIAGSYLVAERVASLMGYAVSEEEILANLSARHIEGTNRILLTYESTKPRQAARVVIRAAVVSSGLISPDGGGSDEHLMAFPDKKTRVSDESPTPVSPKPVRNGLFTLVVGLGLSGALIVGRSLLRR